MRYTQDEINEYIQDNDVKFVKLSFCDVFGNQKIISVLPSMLSRAFEDGFPVDASRIDGFWGPDDDEIFLFPDTSTVSLLPWRPSHGRVARFYCDIRTRGKNPFAQDSRRLLRDAVKLASLKGISVTFGTENEFYLFKLDEDGGQTDIPFDNAGYMDEAPDDRGEDVRRDICLTLEEMGISPRSSRHIGGPGQNRIDFNHGPALEHADNVMTFRSVVKMMASRNGLWANFSPKPIEDEPGSGFRISMRPEKESKGCTDAFMAGLLEHIRELTVFLNRTPESYERFGFFGAPKKISWADAGRSVLMRKKESGRIEISSPDSMLNPYLAFALLLFAGIDGVERKLELPPVGEERGTLPTNLHEAAEAAAGSEFIKQLLPREIFEAYTLRRNKA